MTQPLLWHTYEVKEVANILDVDLSTGLSSLDAAKRLTLSGFNHLATKSQFSSWQLFISQFTSPLILILIGASLLAALIGNFKDAGTILSVVFINATISFYQEYRAERSLYALKKMLPFKTKVKRDNKKIEISAHELVPGDIVFLNAGDRVPADGRLITTVNFHVDESAFTGESEPANKQNAPITSVHLPITDRVNLVYMSTMVTRGRAEMVVTATGMQTEMGRLSQQLTTIPDTLSPLQKQLDKLGKQLGIVALTLVVILFVMQLYRKVEITHAILDSIALAVAAMPEGLPVVVTMTLALGMHQIAKYRAVIKRLASVETLGCTTVICSDKTGTLTLNQMSVKSFFYLGLRFDVSGEGYNSMGTIALRDNQIPLPDLTELLVPIMCCNNSRVDNGKVIGDPTEAALLILAEKGGLDFETTIKAFPRINEIAFDSKHKFMATFHKKGENIQLFVKGAPEILLKFCTHTYSSDQIIPLENESKTRISNEYGVLAKCGLRGLLIASRLITADEFVASVDLTTYVSGLTFLGLIGLMDPPRPEAKEAILKCKAAGIAVKMITGDHRDTGVAIANQLGLFGKAVTGSELDAMSPEELSDIIDKTVVFARALPQHKVKIVQALQTKGHVVAMTGDGVNDAPALKAADIGIAMGLAGTEVAKEAASMVLTDDNFATIVNAIKQGRALYDNIIKFIRFQLSTTIGALLTVFFAPLLNFPEPFNPLQILWVAMIMDGPPAVSLALDPARVGIMSEPPRSRSAPILSWARLRNVAIFGLIMMGGSLAVFDYALQTNNERNALTLIFTTFVLFQFFNIFNARFENISSFGKEFFKNKLLWCSLASVIGLQILVVHWPPAQSIFGTTDISINQWILAISVSSLILFIEETRKGFVRYFSHRH